MWGIHGISARANAVVFLGPYNDQSLPCGRISRALLLIVMQIVIGKKTFREKELFLRFDGTQVGQRYLLKMPSRVVQTNDAGTLTTSNGWTVQKAYTSHRSFRFVSLNSFMYVKGTR